MELRPQQLYRHYKNKFYKYISVVKHSESLEDLVLYKALYKNSESEFWVRPKEMFFDKIIIDGNPKPRFEPILFKYQVYKELDEKLNHKLTLFIQSIFKDFEEDKFTFKLKDKTNILILIVSINTPNDSSKIIGFKIGYERSHDTFYSWLGGIDKNYQSLGIGLELIKQQHKWCETMGYKCVETKTKNQWKKMLLLNLKFGFEIYGTEYNSNKDLKILLRKKL